MNAAVNRNPFFKAEIPAGERILLVDDDPSILNFLHTALEQHGFRMFVAHRGEDALTLAETAAPSLILLDIDMPGMCGFETCRRLKASRSTSRIPVIFLSGHSDTHNKIQGFEQGASDFIGKPFDFLEVLARLNTQIELRRVHNEFEQLHEEANSLLLNILPHSIAERLKSGESNPVDRFSETTICFCDLVGFTAMAADLDPDLLVAFLNHIFSKIDGLVEKHGMEKIKTIGDAYMAAAGVPDPNPHHACAVADFALEVIPELRSIENEWGLPIRMRIGIDSGPVVAGVIGSKKLTYDLWGDTVNTASRMESSCAANQIHVSATTRKLLGKKYEFTSRGGIEIKGKGTMETFYLNRKARSRLPSLAHHHSAPTVTSLSTADAPNDVHLHG